MIIAMTSCSVIAVQIRGVMPNRPARRLMAGNRRYIGIKALMPVTNMFLAPHRLTSFAKKKNWKTPLKRPKAKSRKPMVDGSKPSPPNSIGVE